MSDLINEYGHFIYDEMMTHPAFFTHPGAKKIAVLSNRAGIINEVLKHTSIVEAIQVQNATGNNDPRLSVFAEDVMGAIHHAAPNSFDIIIAPELADCLNFAEKEYQKIFQTLEANGIFIQPAESAFKPADLKATCKKVKNAGFSELQILHFPQPGSTTGWGAAILAIKQGHFKRIREKDVFNKTFSTRYYNFDIHKAALVMPEFMREEEFA